MAKKEFRLEKKDWEHQFALISHNMLKKTNRVNFYIKKSTQFFFDKHFGFFCCRFLDQIRHQKTVFWTNIKTNYFFNPINIFYNLQNLLLTCLRNSNIKKILKLTRELGVSRQDI